MLQKLIELGISKPLLIVGSFVVVAAAGVATYQATNPNRPTPAANPVALTSPSQALSQATSLAPSTSPVIKTSSPTSPTAASLAAAKPASPSPSPIANAKSDDEPPLLLKGIGINLDYYDPATGRAGDMVFTKSRLQFNTLFTEYGFTIPASQTSSGQDKRNPQPTWLAPMGTKVHSLVDGLVTNVSTLYSNDFTIMVATDTKSKWQYETEHVTNPLVKVGDRVTAGQVIAEVSPHNKEGSSGYGMVEIGILKGGNPPQHICPFAYLDPSVKDDLQKKLLAFYKAWEEYRGDTTIHNESAQSVPGCLTSDAIDG